MIDYPTESRAWYYFYISCLVLLIAAILFCLVGFPVAEKLASRIPHHVIALNGTYDMIAISGVTSYGDPSHGYEYVIESAGGDFYRMHGVYPVPYDLDMESVTVTCDRLSPSSRDFGNADRSMTLTRFDYNYYFGCRLWGDWFETDS